MTQDSTDSFWDVFVCAPFSREELVKEDWMEDDYDSCDYKTNSTIEDDILGVTYRVGVRPGKQVAGAQDGQLFAVKVVRNSTLERMGQEGRDVLKDFELHWRTKHINIISLYHVVEDYNRDFYVVIEYAEGGTLADRICPPPRPPTRGCGRCSSSRCWRTSTSKARRTAT